MEPDPVGGRRLGREPGHPRRRGMAQFFRPAVPAAPEALAEGAEGRVLTQQRPLPADETIEAGVTPAPDPAPQRLERRGLQPVDRVALDQRFAIEGPSLARPLGEPGQLTHPRELADAEEQRIAKQPARGKVRTGLLRHQRRRRRERVDHRDPRPLGLRPLPEPSEIVEVADAPALSRPRGVELNRPAPGPEVVRQITLVRRHDQARFGCTFPEDLMVAVGKVRRQPSIDVGGRAVFQADLGRPERRARTAAHHDHAIVPARRARPWLS